MAGVREVLAARRAAEEVVVMVGVLGWVVARRTQLVMAECLVYLGKQAEL
jgi:hypothetical protein